MVLFGDIPFGKLIVILTSSAVLSSIFLIFIFPLSFAFIIESIREPVFTEYGTLLMIIWSLPEVSISLLTLIFPPFSPFLY